MRRYIYYVDIMINGVPHTQKREAILHPTKGWRSYRLGPPHPNRRQDR